jgi:hypothetical protein
MHVFKIILSYSSCSQNLAESSHGSLPIWLYKKIYKKTPDLIGPEVGITVVRLVWELWLTLEGYADVRQRKRLSFAFVCSCFAFLAVSRLPLLPLTQIRKSRAAICVSCSSRTTSFLSFSSHSTTTQWRILCYLRREYSVGTLGGPKLGFELCTKHIFFSKCLSS